MSKNGRCDTSIAAGQEAVRRQSAMLGSVHEEMIPVADFCLHMTGNVSRDDGGILWI